MVREGRTSGGAAFLLGSPFVYYLVYTLNFYGISINPSSELEKKAIELAVMSSAIALGVLIGPHIELFRRIDRAYWSFARKNRQKAREKNRDRKRKLMEILRFRSK